MTTIHLYFQLDAISILYIVPPIEHIHTMETKKKLLRKSSSLLSLFATPFVMDCFRRERRRRRRRQNVRRCLLLLSSHLYLLSSSYGFQSSHHTTLNRQTKRNGELLTHTIRINVRRALAQCS